MNAELFEFVGRTAASTDPALSAPAVASASASLLGMTAIALFVQNTWVKMTNPYPAAAEVLGTVHGYIDASTDGVRDVLNDAARGMGAEDEEALPGRFQEVGEPTPAAVREIIGVAMDPVASPSVRRTAIIGVGIMAAGDPAAALGALRRLLAAPETGIAEAALRSVDWGAVEGLGAELRALASDGGRPAWLRAYAADLAG